MRAVPAYQDAALTERTGRSRAERSGVERALDRALDRASLLTLENPLYRECLAAYAVDAVRRDSSPRGDITTQALFPEGLAEQASAVVIAKERGVIAGLAEAVFLFKKLGSQASLLVKDGAEVAPGTHVLRVSGHLSAVLSGERRSLELLRRMSGIATATRSLIEEIRTSGGTARIAATRKCPWELLDKRAVALGGGLTHRLSLSDAVLIKDNHLARLRLFGEKDALRSALASVRADSAASSAAFVEVEVTSLGDAELAAVLFRELWNGSTQPTLILLDNMTPKEVAEVHRRLSEKGMRSHIVLEASGGITPKSAPAYAKSGVDVLSLGWLTHSAQCLDLSLEIDREIEAGDSAAREALR